MEGQKKTATSSSLTRTHSSLLRSSPTVRSSIQSLTEIDELVSSSSSDEHLKRERTTRSRSSSGPTAAAAFFVFSSVAFSSVLLFFFFFFFFFYFYLRRNDEISTSESLLLALVFIAVALFLAGRHKSRIIRSIAVIRQRLFFFVFRSRRGRRSGKPIRWAIGDSESEGLIGNGNKSHQQKIGVEFYCNGDFNEGEFHKGKCNGSGVYNYYVNGRYEGDWVDGKYDGYGIERDDVEV